ncbi:unnamed protein product [Brachionus calyciflorus]|uniref:TTF-type domain-containing protein n=1 Tax=Brachionus calyciflorus TaxID=104777 RepID=A0A814PLV7_9BILA|nr:unnamed protein product [Brachionus calyciflorus]
MIKNYFMKKTTSLIQKSQDNSQPNKDYELEKICNDSLLIPNQPKLDFPIDKDKRKFLPIWYKNHPWLEYDAKNDKAFCFACKNFPSSKSSKAFTSEGYSKWKNAVSNFITHQNSAEHMIAMERWESRKLNKPKCIDLINSQYSKNIAENRQNLTKIIEIVKYLAKQGLAFRGHDECENSNNMGNFKELIDWYSSRDRSFKSFIENSKKANYCSKTTQNELIGILSDQVLKTLVDKVNGNTFYSLIIDETTDISKIEQLSICVRFVDKELNIQEKFIGFYQAQKTDGEFLFNLVKQALADLGLPFSNIVGQCYDGGSNMSGSYKGLSSRIKNLNNKALYVHCYAHKLNLALKGTCSQIIEVRNCIGIVNSIYNLIDGSAKRHNIFKNIQNEVNESNLTIKKLSDTRWSSRDRAFKAVKENLPTIFETLKEIDDTDHSQNGSFANSLLKSIKSFDFYFYLLALSEIFEIINFLSVYLQNTHLDLKTAKEMTFLAIEKLENSKNDDFFERLWDDSIKFCEKFGIDEPQLPRQRSVNKRCSEFLPVVENYTDTKIQFKTKLNKIIEHLIAELNERFSDDLKPLIYIYELFFKNQNDLTLDSIRKNLAIYKDIINFESLLSEMKVWINFKNSNQNELKLSYSNISSLKDIFVERKFFSLLPNISKLLQIYLTVPISSASAERSFSCLKRLKTWLRNSMSQERLSNLAILCIEKEELDNLSLAKIENIFISNKERKVPFCYNN